MATAKKTADKETKTTKAAKTEAKAETKAEAKTVKATKTTKAKAETVAETVNVTIEFAGRNTSVNDVVEAVKAAYKADGNTDAIETVNVYVQPENGVAYYVVNGKEEGKSVEI